MKTILISVLLSLLLTTLAYANSVSREWHLVTQNRIVEGAFHKYYHGQVYVKKSNNRIVKIPLYALSKEDMNFALTRQEYESLLQEKENEFHTSVVSGDKISYSGYVFVPLSLALVMGYIIFRSQRQRMVYFPPKIQRLM